MKLKYFFLLPIAAFTLLTTLAPKTALATVRYVVHTDSECGTLDPCYTSIQTAINDSDTGDSIDIQASPDPYVENITLPSDLTDNMSLSIYGTETARTIISGGGSGTVVTADNPATATYTLTLSMWNLTITNAEIGIQASNKLSVTIKNNVFHNLSGTAVKTVNPLSAVEISNNTFYNNGTAINRDTTSPTIKNNIFSTNTVAVSTADYSNMSTNNYSNNGDDGTAREGSAVSCDPSFASITNGDFHLQAGATCCIDGGDSSAGNDAVDPTSPPDIGAYGGSMMDTIPFPISDLEITDQTATSITVTWSANTCYLIDGYKVYYGTASGEYGSPTDAGNVTEFEITGLTGADPPTGAPQLHLYSIASNTLVLAWNTEDVDGATGYEIRYAIDPLHPTLPPSPGLLPDTITTDAGNLTAFPLTGLENNIDYNIIVVPYAKATYYIAVTAYDSTPSAHESDKSNEVNSNIGNKTYGDATTASNEITDFPEALTPNPNLPNKGCFIATAAYGHYSAPQVQALREFRDRYLLTNAPGRAFVRWYYAYGPAAAGFINEHPALKPVVRAALLPAVAGAMFITRTPVFTRTAVLLFVLGLTGFIFYRRKSARQGGTR